MINLVARMFFGILCIFALALAMYAFVNYSSWTLSMLVVSVSSGLACWTLEMSGDGL